MKNQSYAEFKKLAENRKVIRSKVKRTLVLTLMFFGGTLTYFSFGKFSNKENEYVNYEKKTLLKLKVFKELTLQDTFFSTLINSMKNSSELVLAEYVHQDNSILLGLKSMPLVTMDIMGTTIMHESAHFKYKQSPFEFKKFIRRLLDINKIKIDQKDLLQWGEEEFYVDVYTLYYLSIGGDIFPAIKYCYLRNLSDNLTTPFLLYSMKESEINGNKNSFFNETYRDSILCLTENDTSIIRPKLYLKID